MTCSVLVPKQELFLASATMIFCFAFHHTNPFLLFNPCDKASRDVHNVSCLIGRTALDQYMPEQEENEENKKMAMNRADEMKLLFFAFSALGCIGGGLASDLLGRSIANMALLMLTVLAGFSATVARNVIVFETCWCLVAAGAMGSVVIAYVRIIEIVPDSLRLLLSLLLCGLSTALSKTTTLYVVYMAKDWQLVVFFLSLFTCLTLFAGTLRPNMMRERTVENSKEIIPAVMESDDTNVHSIGRRRRSILSSGGEYMRRRFSLARSESFRSCQSDVLPDSEETVVGAAVATVSETVGSVEDSATNAAAEAQNEPEERMLDLFTNLGLVQRFVPLSLSFFISGIIHYGLNMSTDAYFFTYFYSNMIFRGLFDCLAGILASLTCYKTKKSLPVYFFFMSCSGIFSFVMIGSDASKTLEMLATCTSLFIVTASMKILWYISFSSFPTKIRNTAVGICSSAGRLGAMAGIALETGKVYYSPQALGLVGLMAIIAGLSVMFVLPERANKTLLRTMRQETDEKEKEEKEQSGDSNSKPVMNLVQRAMSSVMRFGSAANNEPVNDSENGGVQEAAILNTNCPKKFCIVSSLVLSLLIVITAFFLHFQSR